MTWRTRSRVSPGSISVALDRALATSQVSTSNGLVIKKMSMPGIHTQGERIRPGDFMISVALPGLSVVSMFITLRRDAPRVPGESGIPGLRLTFGMSIRRMPLG